MEIVRLSVTKWFMNGLKIMTYPAEEEAQKAEEAKKKAAERAAKSKASTGKPKSENKAAQEKGKSPAPAENAEEKRTRRNNKDLEGQMDMFSMMGM